MPDPANPVAFITGLTFASAGSFTCNVTPIAVVIAAVPEPAAWAPLPAGLGGPGLTRRRAARRAA